MTTVDLQALLDAAIEAKDPVAFEVYADALEESGESLVRGWRNVAKWMRLPHDIYNQQWRWPRSGRWTLSSNQTIAWFWPYPTDATIPENSTHMIFQSDVDYYGTTEHEAVTKALQALAAALDKEE